MMPYDQGVVRARFPILSICRSLLEVLEPEQLLVTASPQTLQQLRNLNEAVAQYNQVPVSRGSFDDSNGALLLSQYGSNDSHQLGEAAAVHSTWYLALGACGALLTYLQDEQHLALSPKSVQVGFLSPDGHMQIDSVSIESLELVKAIRTGRGSAHKCDSLFRLMNRTKTKCGAKLLRANLLQPLTDLPTISLRQDAIQELCGNTELASDLKEMLGQLPPDLDRVCSQLAQRPSAQGKSDPSKRIALVVQSLILLRETLQALPCLAQALKCTDSCLLQAVQATFSHEVFADLLSTVDNTLDEDTQSAKMSFLNKVQQCFAVRKGLEGMLDLARDVFCRATQQVHDLMATYREQHSLDCLKVQYTAKRGFYMVLQQPGTSLEGGSTAPDLPAGFLPLQSRGTSSLDCTTQELNTLNVRLAKAASDCLVLTEQVLGNALAAAVQHLDRLHKLLDSIALLDMLVSLADLTQNSVGQYVRPRCTETGPLAIVDGRHPTLEAAMEGIFQANSTYLAETCSLHIITGPNMAGKSTYLRQVALIVVMAQIGSFVPAQYASIRLVDKIFTRIGTQDSIEDNSSSFLVEMQEMSYILRHGTQRSLVIIDELGRSTSTVDGTGIAWAMAEHLINLGCPTLLATHFQKLEALPEVYPNCRLHHFKVHAAGSSLNFTRELLPGQQQNLHYGLLLAEAMAMDQGMLARATRIAELVAAESAHGTLLPAGDDSHQQLSNMYSLADKVYSLADAWSCEDDEGCHRLKEQLQCLKQQAQGLALLTIKH
eukprot:jgi/Astpho2/2051/Aster-00547